MSITEPKTTEGVKYIISWSIYSIKLYQPALSDYTYGLMS